MVKWERLDGKGSGMKRRRFSQEFKAKVAPEGIKGQRTANELAQEFGIHANQIKLWKKQLLEAAPVVFSRGKDREAEALERERDRLYRKVGQLQVEVDWLKKKTGLLD
jgi:transposase